MRAPSWWPLVSRRTHQRERERREFAEAAHQQAHRQWAALFRAIRDHSCGSKMGCLCQWDDDGNPIGEHGPRCWQPFEAERTLKAAITPEAVEAAGR